MKSNPALLYENGDRWKLDCLIPNSQRRLVGPQVPRTSRIRVGTTARVIESVSQYRPHTPIHTGHETGIEEQERLRRRYGNEIPLPGDRLI